MAIATRSKPPAHHKKVTGKHHKTGKHYLKAYWPYLPIGLIIGLTLLANTALGGAGNVLGDQSDFSPATFLQLTNQQRTAQSEPALQLNQLLDNAAQAKAQDMVQRDYWSHDTPDGQTPWTFITAAGYNYVAAGENLAYGFSTAEDTMTAWMNSPEHRANILNATYQEAGFGVAESQNYQGQGPQTVIVAFYATPAAAKAAVSYSPPVLHAPAPAPPAATTPAPTPSPTPTTQAASPVATAAVQPKTLAAPAPRPVARIQLVSNISAAWLTTAATLAGTLAIGLFVIRHGFIWHRMLVRSERFVIKNPWVDILIVLIGALCYLALQTSGYIG